jgi:hypothetical protein
MLIGLAVVWFGFPTKNAETELVAGYRRSDETVSA